MKIQTEYGNWLPLKIGAGGIGRRIIAIQIEPDDRRYLDSPGSQERFWSWLLHDVIAKFPPGVRELAKRLENDGFNVA